MLALASIIIGSTQTTNAISFVHHTSPGNPTRQTLARLASKMLLKDITALALLFCIAFCSDLDGSLTPDRLTEIITEALSNSNVSNSLSPTILSIMSSLLKKDTECSSQFFSYIVEHHGLFDVSLYEDYNSLFWSELVDKYFYEFAKEKPAEAKNIVENVVVPSHSLLSKVPGYFFNVDAFLQHEDPALDTFFNPILEHFFNAELSKILYTRFFYYYNRHRFALLLKRYANSRSWDDPEINYACTFLLNLKFADIKNSFAQLHPRDHAIYYNIVGFASKVYDRLSSESPAKARQAKDALEKVLPSEYRKTHAKSFKATIQAYVQSQFEATVDQPDL